MAAHTQGWLLLLLTIALCNSSQADSGDDIPSLADAVDLLRIEEILSLNGRISDKDIAKNKLDDENEALRQKIDEMREETKKVIQQQLKEKEELEKELEGSRVLVKFMMKSLHQSEQMTREREAAIVIQTEMVEKALTQNEACKHENADNSKLLFESQETIRLQGDSIEKLENIFKYTEALNASYHELEAIKTSEDNCDLATFVSTMSKVLSNQENEIADLTEFMENDKKIKGYLESIHTELLKEHKTVDPSDSQWEILKSYQTLIEKQSKAIRDLSAMASYSANVTYDFRYEEDEDGNLVSASSCQCLPEIPSNTQISTVLGKQGQKILSMWSQWEYQDCFEWVTPDNTTEDCISLDSSSVLFGMTGNKTRRRVKELDSGSWEEETEVVSCHPCMVPGLQQQWDWSNWTRCEDRTQQRWKLRLTGHSLNTDLEERECSPHHPQCEMPYTILSEDWRRINYSSSSRSPYECDKRSGFETGWYRFVFNGKDNGRIPHEAAPKMYRDSAKTCMTYTTAWMDLGDGPVPAIGEPPKFVTMKFQRESGSNRDTISSRVVTCEDGNGLFYLYELRRPDECDLAWCATTDMAIGY